MKNEMPDKETLFQQMFPELSPLSPTRESRAHVEIAPAVLALDAGFTALGWAVLKAGRIVALGCIRTAKTTRKGRVRVADDDAERTQVLARELAGIIRTHSVQGLVAELPSAGAKGARAIGCMARAGAIVATVAELLTVPAEWLTPGDIKAVAGSKAASKADVEAAVLCRWPDAPLPKVKAEREHVADALACYIAAENGTLVRMLNR